MEPHKRAVLRLLFPRQHHRLSSRQKQLLETMDRMPNDTLERAYETMMGELTRPRRIVRPPLHLARQLSLVHVLTVHDGAAMPPYASGFDQCEVRLIEGLLDGTFDKESPMHVRIFLWLALWNHSGSIKWLADKASVLISADTTAWNHLQPGILADVVLALVWLADSIDPDAKRAMGLADDGDGWIMHVPHWLRLLYGHVNPLDRSHAQTDPQCVVCIDARADHVFEPCGHLCVCDDDWSTMRDMNDSRGPRCPLCRSPIEAAWTVRSLYTPLPPISEWLAWWNTFWQENSFVVPRYSRRARGSTTQGYTSSFILDPLAKCANVYRQTAGTSRRANP